MKFLSKLFGQKKTQLLLTSQDIKDAGACPNCWGRQKYEDQFIRFEKKQLRNILQYDRTAQKAFVQNFIEKHITGIRLEKHGELIICPKCSGKSKIIQNKAV